MNAAEGEERGVPCADRPCRRRTAIPYVRQIVRGRPRSPPRNGLRLLRSLRCGLHRRLNQICPQHTFLLCAPMPGDYAKHTNYSQKRRYGGPSTASWHQRESAPAGLPGVSHPRPQGGQRGRACGYGWARTRRGRVAAFSSASSSVATYPWGSRSMTMTSASSIPANRKRPLPFTLLASMSTMRAPAARIIPALTSAICS